MKKPEDFECILGGEQWKVFFVRKGHPKLDGGWGITIWNRKEIYVRYDLSNKNFLDTLLHELRHGQSRQDYYAEKWVTQVSTETAEALLKCGRVAIV